jgi:hypothetical protein
MHMWAVQKLIDESRALHKRIAADTN